jgi:RHS repeat-associated protein
VQVVAQIKNEDQVSGTALVSTFSYHHGCYDGVEREFRGFGLVERRDAETLPVDAKATDVAPVLSKTWYHTGVPQADGSLSRQFAHDYFQGDTLAHTFPDSVFDPPDTKLDDETRRQALRALKGAVLRQEVYAPTAPAAMPGQKQDAPYAVTEHNYLVKLLQTQGQNPNAVLFVYPQETISYDYERNPNDPRIHHQFTLGVDEYGNVLHSCDIAYGRRKDEKISEQNSLKMTVRENNFINKTVPGIRLLGIPSESKSYEITNPPLPAHNYFSFSELSDFLLWPSFVKLYELLLGTLLSSAKAYLLAWLNSPELREFLNRNLSNTEPPRLLAWQRYYYWNTDTGKPYALGEIDAQALLANVETAEFSDAQIKTAFTGAQTEVELASKLQAQGRYRPDQGYWWNPGLSESYEGASKFFLPKATTDAFNHATSYAYDNYCLLPVKVTDALDNESKIEKIDYQTLQAQKTSDINGNMSEVLFDPLGLVTVWSEYKPLDDNKIAGFLPLTPYPSKSSTNKTYVPKNPAAHRIPIAELIAHPEDYLQGAKTYFYYDLFSWKNRRTPVHTVSLVPENYPGTDGKNTGAIQIHIDYSDGFGRAVQSTTKVEPGKAHTCSGDTITLPDRETAERWLTSGRTVYNNKGLPVKQYEPYYIDTCSYIDNPLLNKFGVSPTLHYDPLGRLIRTDTPKGFFSKVEFSPWLERHFDENDTVKDSDYYQKHNADTAETFKWERDALKKAAEFYDTPHETVLDNLGRVVQDIQINVRKIDNTEVKEKYRLISHYQWDIQGNQTASADPRLARSGQNNFETLYSMTGTPLKTISADAGPRWLLHNVMGGPIYTRDARGFETVTRYDALHRPVEVSIEGAMKPKQVVERIVYGDNLNAEQKLQLPNPEKNNLRGQPYLHYDQAGLVSFPRYNCMGLPLKIIRQLRMDYQQEANWPSLTGTLNPQAAQGGSVNGQAKPLTCNALLEKQSYRTTYQYDALGRVTQETNADGNVTVPSYHLSGHIDQIRVDGKPYVKGTVYNAKGQRLSITYGNDVITRYEYETETFRLRRIDTTRLKGSEQLQDLHYSYDPVGNITHISDRLQDVVIHDNQKAHPESDYSYDALYRLVTATGREHPTLSETRQQRHGDFQGFSLPQVGDGQVLKKYRQNFSYDDGGNLYHVQHIGKNPWTQQLTVSGNSNRAVDIELADTPAKVNDAFDANGNQVKLPGLAGIAWNYRDNIACATVIDRSAEKKHSDEEYYVYDGGGSRIRKVTERYANDNTTLNIEETIYLGSLEIKRSLSKPVAANASSSDLPPRPQGEGRGEGSKTTELKLKEERHSLRIMDGDHAVATRLNWIQGEPPAGIKNPQIRYRLDNHLGSATLELDESAQIISYEEYYPYGGTSFVMGRNQAEVKLKQYRYSGKEQDSVTGFYYYGFRYYAPWLCRWLSPDPAGTVDGLNLYGFVRNVPVTNIDLAGTCSGTSPNNKMPTLIGRPKQDPSRKSTETINQIEVEAAIKDNSYKNDTIRMRWKGSRDPYWLGTSGIEPHLTKRHSRPWTANQKSVNRKLDSMLKKNKDFSGVGRWKSAAEISHAIAGSLYGPNDMLSAHSASAHQNTEFLAIETGVKILSKKYGKDLRIKVTNYVNLKGIPGSLKAARYKIYIKKLKMFDHITLGSRGNIDKDEACKLFKKVSSLDPDSKTQISGKGIFGNAPTLPEMQASQGSSIDNPMFTNAYFPVIPKGLASSSLESAQAMEFMNSLLKLPV